MAYKERNKILPGVRVRVSFADHEKQDPAKIYDGQEFVVKSKHVVGKYANTYYYELYGANGADGMPYGFMEEDLIRI